MKEGPGNKALDVYGTEKEVSEYFLSWQVVGRRLTIDHTANIFTGRNQEVTFPIKTVNCDNFPLVIT